MNSSKQLDDWIRLALEGNRSAMETLLMAIQPDIYKLSLRFLMFPHEAEDATQEILLKITLRLAQFQFNSTFKTWVYRIATNHLIDSKKGKKAHNLSLTEFSDDLHHGLDEQAISTAFEASLLSEVRIGCTLAMLQCLTSSLRAAYIMGEILEFNHIEAANILELAPATYRKRISRAKSIIVDFMQENCGLVNSVNHCRCHKRVKPALQLGRINADNLIFSSSVNDAKQFPNILDQVRKLDNARQTAALFRAHNITVNNYDFACLLKSLVSQHKIIE